MYTYLITLYFIAQVYLIGEFFSRRTWVKFMLESHKVGVYTVGSGNKGGWNPVG